MESPSKHRGSGARLGSLLSQERIAGSLLGAPLLVWQLSFFLAPLVMMLAMTFWSVRSYRLVFDMSLQAWSDVFSSPYFYGIYARTLLLALGSAALATAAALPLAYAVAFHVSGARRRLLLATLIMPYFTSYLVRSYTWRFILEDHGVINALIRVAGVGPVRFQGSIAALLIGYMGYFFCLVAFVVSLGMMAVDQRLMEAARNLGASPRQVFINVVLPLSRTAIVTAFALGFTLALGDYVVPSYIGGGTRPTLSILIVNTIQGQSNYPRAAVLATVMLGTLAVVLALGQRLAFRSRSPGHA
jgi:spermidine/putrescine transport system permease protein/putrescine transport system permease protein